MAPHAIAAAPSQARLRALAERGTGIVGALAVAALVVFGLNVIRDPDGPAGMYAFLLDLVGQASGAAELREGGLDPLHAKLTIMAIALAIGIGGIWALYAGLNAATDLLGRRWARAGAAVRLHRRRPSPCSWPTSSCRPPRRSLRASQSRERRRRRGASSSPRPRCGSPSATTSCGSSSGPRAASPSGWRVAALFDRVKREALAKVFVFLPLAISMVGAAVIWRFMYAWQPAGEEQIGLVNAVIQGTGGTPRVWMQVSEPPINTMLLIVIMIWLQTGFAMVVLSAALKGVSGEILEAARIDGANERQVFVRVVIPMIKGTIIAVATTVSIAILKVFDIVYVMTGGRFETEVLANRMFAEMFTFRNFGRASAIAVILFLAVVPIMIVNIRNLRRQGIGR